MFTLASVPGAHWAARGAVPPAPTLYGPLAPGPFRALLVCGAAPTDERTSLISLSDPLWSLCCIWGRRLAAMPWRQVILSWMTLLTLVFASAGASARADVSPKPHLGAIDLAAAICIEASGLASAEEHLGNPRLSTADTSDVPHAAGGAPKIHMGQQGKHIVGHNNFLQGSSVLTADPSKLAARAGTGTPVNNVARGQPGFRERVNFGDTIGQYVDEATGQATETTMGIIHYGMGGIHVVPARPGGG